MMRGTVLSTVTLLGVVLAAVTFMDEAAAAIGEGELRSGRGHRGTHLLLHLTDVHLSALPESDGGDPRRYSDLVSLSSDLLARWPVAAAVVTGDLTEAKDRYGRGRQDEQEWQTYAEAWRALSSLGGIPSGNVYDIRGNHDTFDSGARCGPRDHYCRYSTRAAAAAGAAAAGAAAEAGGAAGAAAAGATAAGATAATAEALQRQRLLLQQHAEGPDGRVFIDPVYDKAGGLYGTQSGGAALRTNGGAGNHSRGGGSAACPVFVLVGVDASLDPGMRSPTNFLGVVRQDVLEELDERLEASIAQMRSAGCAPPYISYGHYPLSTIAYPWKGWRYIAGSSSSSSRDGGRGVVHSSASLATSVQQVLTGHGVSAYLCGHLHGAFGRRLHRLHAASPPPGQTPAGAAGSMRPSGHGYMQELESVDWKFARTVRLVSVDAGRGGSSDGGGSGSVLSFVDLTYNAGPAGPSLVSHDPTCEVSSHLALITSPPDARYSPQLLPYMPYGNDSRSGDVGSAEEDGGGDVGGSFIVRALLLPFGSGSGGDGGGGGTAAAASPHPPAVQLLWSCGRRLAHYHPCSDALSSGRGWRRRRGPYEVSGVLQMRLEADGPKASSYVADLATAACAAVPTTRQGGSSDGDGGGGDDDDNCGVPVSCRTGLLVVQVRVDGGDGAISTSAERLLLWRPPGSALESSQYPSPGTEPQSSRRRRRALSLSLWAHGGDSDLTTKTSPTICPAALHQTWLEWTVMHVPWHRLGMFTFVVQWCVLVVGLLLLPRLVVVVRQYDRQRRRRLLRNPLAVCVATSGGGLNSACTTAANDCTAVAEGRGSVDRDLDLAGEGVSTSVCVAGPLSATALRRSASSSSVSSSGGGGVGGGGHGGGGGGTRHKPSPPGLRQQGMLQPQRRTARVSGVAAVALAAVVRLGRGLLWPLRDCVELASHPHQYGPWVALTLFCIYLAVGPWLAAEFTAPEGALPSSSSYLSYGILTPYGIFMRGGGGTTAVTWVAAPSEDYVVVVNALMLLCVAPSVLLCASVAARWRQQAAAIAECAGAAVVQTPPAPPPLGLCVSWRQAVAATAIAVLNASLCWKLWSGLGYVPLALSPAAGWLLPLMAVWLWLTRRWLLQAQLAAGTARG